MSNPFEDFDIRNLSPSNINKFIAAPDAWVASYIYKVRFPGGWAMHQGTSVERGVEYGIYNPDAEVEECVEIATRSLIKSPILMAGTEEQLAKRRPIVRQMVETALEQLRPYGVPLAPPRGDRQWKISIPVNLPDGGVIDAIGYLDFRWPEMVVDLKTTSSAPSRLSLSHAIQGTVYQMAVAKETGEVLPMKFLYVLSRKKDPYVWIELTEDDSREALAVIRHNVRAMFNLLRVCRTKDEVRDMVPHDPSSFYWSDAEYQRNQLFL